jgi:hypothetical protein
MPKEPIEKIQFSPLSIALLSIRTARQDSVLKYNFAKSKKDFISSIANNLESYFSNSSLRLGQLQKILRINPIISKGGFSRNPLQKIMRF